MKILFILSLLLICSISYGKSLEEKFMDPGVTYITSGKTVAFAQVVSGGSVLTSYNVSSNPGSVFNLNYISISGNLDVPSATATNLGSCSLQIPTGTTVAIWPFTNATTSSQSPMILAPKFPIPVTSSFAISCAPLVASKIDWYVNYGGWQY